MENKRVLAIGAHPDDMEQFCGGTLLLLKEAGFEIFIVPLTAGECGSRTLASKEIVAIRQKEAKEAAKIIGANYESLNITDGCIEYNLETVKRLVEVIRRINPLIIFTHPIIDYMADHAHCGQLVLWAIPEATHPNFYSECDYPALTLQPYVFHTDPQGLIGIDGQIVKVNTIVDISEQIEKKLTTFSTHKSQMTFLKSSKKQIDSVEKTRRWAIIRGQQVRILYGEGFTQQLLEQYPRKNILAELLKDKVFIL